MPPFGILANHKIKMCHNSIKKNNDTKDYSKQLGFLNSEPYYASKKIVNQLSDFLARRTGSYRHKKALFIPLGRCGLVGLTSGSLTEVGGFRVSH